jgi:hypothetical protein
MAPTYVGRLGLRAVKLISFQLCVIYACKNRTAPEAVSDGYAPFYMRKTDRFIASEQY